MRTVGDGDGGEVWFWFWFAWLGVSYVVYVGIGGESGEE